MACILLFIINQYYLHSNYRDNESQIKFFELLGKICATMVWRESLIISIYRGLIFRMMEGLIFQFECFDVEGKTTKHFCEILRFTT